MALASASAAAADKPGTAGGDEAAAGMLDVVSPEELRRVSAEVGLLAGRSALTTRIRASAARQVRAALRHPAAVLSALSQQQQSEGGGRGGGAAVELANKATKAALRWSPGVNTALQHIRGCCLLLSSFSRRGSGGLEVECPEEGGGGRGGGGMLRAGGRGEREEEEEEEGEAAAHVFTACV